MTTYKNHLSSMTKENIAKSVIVIVAILAALLTNYAWANESMAKGVADGIIVKTDAKSVQVIEFKARDDRTLDPQKWRITQKNNRTQIELDLGEPLAHLILLHVAPMSSEKFRVDRQYETSLTLMNEGPHYDLLNWKHYISKWQRLPEVKANTFLSNEITSSEFPTVTTQEIMAAVTDDKEGQSGAGEYALEKRWGTIAAQCKSATDYPCGVSISRVRLKISVKEQGEWKKIHTIDLIIPMGC